MPNKLVAISDLHMSAQALDDFDPEIEQKFVAFLSWLASGHESVELVINGDFLDFVQAPPVEGVGLSGTISSEGQALSYTEAQSVQKLNAIYAAHPQVFEALRKFLDAKPGHQLTILPGNHDVDLFWPAVRATLKGFVAPTVGERFRVHLERAYRPPAFPGVWIEHGHQFDKINSFFIGVTERWSAATPPILRDSTGTQRLVECLGTRFLIRFLNRLDRDYPYVDNVKPFSVFIRLFAASALVSGYAPLRVAITMWRLLYFLSRTGFTRPTDLLSADDGPIDTTMAMCERLRTANEQSKILQARVHGAGFKVSLPLSLVLDDPSQSEDLMIFLSEHPELLDGLEPDDSGYLGLEGEEGSLTLARGFHVNESKELLVGAGSILASTDVKLVVMGHTHEPLNRPAGLAYVNTGSWTRYYQRSGSERLRPWSVLKQASRNEFPYALKYLEIEPGNVENARLAEQQ